jgi:phosphate transport system permease protein
MKDTTPPTSPISARIEKSLKKRHAKEVRFKSMGLLAIAFGFLMLVILVFDISSKAMPAFYQHHLKIDIEYNTEWLGLNVDEIQSSSSLNDGNQQLSQQELNTANYRSMLRNSLYQMFPEVQGRKDKKALFQLLSSNTEFSLRDRLISNPDLLGTKESIWLLADGDVDSYLKSDAIMGEKNGRINDKQAQWLKTLSDNYRIEASFNFLFFTNSDSRDPELAGIKGALVGTLLTMLVTLAISFPLGLATAIYLEEFAPRNRWTDLIEININNLAAVPSIVFGLLGLAVIINLFGLPRSASLVGGIVLSLMTLPTIIIASRASIKAVPNSIKEAATGLGASKMQVTLGHVVPIAMPGILTGTIIGIAQALGETAPLLMIGMVAFIVDVPAGFTDAATVMPVQIFLWADSPEQGFLAKTSAAIFVLLIVLFTITFSATLLRKKFEQKGK